jgi:hypothetical protein
MDIQIIEELKTFYKMDIHHPLESDQLSNPSKARINFSILIGKIPEKFGRIRYTEGNDQE